MPLDSSQILDAIPETKRYFRRRLARAPIDFESFMTPLKACKVNECLGMCCYDGVCLDEDEERYVSAIIEAHPVFFKQIGITPDNAFEDAEFLDVETRKTRTRRFQYPPSAKFPKHFDKTACIFRFPDGRCSLQSLAMEHGEHPWAYKPLSCWLHPISLERNDRTIIWLPTLDNDHLSEPSFPGYAPYTGCGCATKGGKPAYQVLAPELKTLGAIVGRDVYGEIKAWHAKQRDA